MGSFRNGTPNTQIGVTKQKTMAACKLTSRYHSPRHLPSEQC